MIDKQPQKESATGMAGLGVMGRNFLLNMADHGPSVVGYFGAHTYERSDAKGTFHTEWEKA